MAEAAEVIEGDDVFKDASDNLGHGDEEVEQLAEQLAETLPLQEGELLQFEALPQGVRLSGQEYVKAKEREFRQIDAEVAFKLTGDGAEDVPRGERSEELLVSPVGMVTGQPPSGNLPPGQKLLQERKVGPTTSSPVEGVGRGLTGAQSGAGRRPPVYLTGFDKPLEVLVPTGVDRPRRPGGAGSAFSVGGLGARSKGSGTRAGAAAPAPVGAERSAWPDLNPPPDGSGTVGPAVKSVVVDEPPAEKTTTATATAPRPIVKPMTFSGEGSSLNEYLAHFDLCVTINGCHVSKMPVH